jgi:hypothetical protein
MSLDPTIDEGSLAAVAALLGVPDAEALAELRYESLQQRTHRQLLEVSKKLGLAGVSRLTKDALAAKLGKTLPELARSRRAGASPATKGPRSNGGAAVAQPSTRPSATVVAKAEPTEEPAAADPVLSHKFEVGKHGAAKEEPRTIPWSYSQDRVTAMPVDADKLFVYWEITDEAVKQARAKLGNGGPGAWLNLRVYDITGRIFDGTNAHSYFDHQIERHDRQWFFSIGKPSSQTVVELGLRSHEGFFVKVARSSRVDFPRRGPVAWGEPEWMSVRASTGEVVPAGRGVPGGNAGALESSGGYPHVHQHGGQFQPLPLWHMRAPWEEVIRDDRGGYEERVEWQESWRTETGEFHRTFTWESPLMISSWESGPYTYPVDVPEPTSESFEGALKVFKNEGRTHIMYGPWEVVIRGLGAQFTRQVLARWEMQRSWVAEEGHEIRGVRVVGREGAGSSERLLLGASERRWMGESEMRIRGASERFYVGASERRIGGASETHFMGASQWAYRGGSERRLIGASETRLRGASERLLAGGSELRMRGASELMLGGASEWRMGGSEARLGGASEERLQPPEGVYPPSPQAVTR